MIRRRRRLGWRTSEPPPLSPSPSRSERSPCASGFSLSGPCSGSFSAGAFGGGEGRSPSGRLFSRSPSVARSRGCDGSASRVPAGAEWVWRSSSKRREPQPPDQIRHRSPRAFVAFGSRKSRARQTHVSQGHSPRPPAEPVTAGQARRFPLFVHCEFQSKSLPNPAARLNRRTASPLAPRLPGVALRIQFLGGMIFGSAFARPYRMMGAEIVFAAGVARIVLRAQQSHSGIDAALGSPGFALSLVPVQSQRSASLSATPGLGVALYLVGVFLFALNDAWANGSSRTTASGS